MNNQLVEIEIYGKTYKVVSDKDPHVVQTLAKLVDSRLNDLASHMKDASFQSLLLLTCLNLAEEIRDLKGDVSSKIHMVESAVTQLISEIDRKIS